MRAVAFLARQRDFVPAVVTAIVIFVCATALGRYFLLGIDIPCFRKTNAKSVKILCAVERSSIRENGLIRVSYKTGSLRPV